MLTQIDPITRLRDSIAPARQRLEDHPLYRQVKTMQHLQIFMESHVFAVWDFMSLLKSLQAGLTCVTTPWLPSRYPQSCRLINEIVLGEESDLFGTAATSHFELYRKAMAESGAGTYSLDLLITRLQSGDTLSQALHAAAPPLEAEAFVQSTFHLLNQNKLHVTAAAFTFGREDLIPGMFHHMVKDLRRNLQKVDLFEYYLNRHIELDGDSHGPLALQMVSELCGFDDRKWQEAADAARQAIEARVALWDGILQRIERA